MTHLVMSDTPYSILVVFTTTTALEDNLEGGNFVENEEPPANNRGFMLRLAPVDSPPYATSRQPTGDFCQQTSPVLGYSL